eukprot:scaffold96261_cov34-Tisochrysis_lutea.AAC.7
MERGIRISSSPRLTRRVVRTPRKPFLPTYSSTASQLAPEATSQLASSAQPAGPSAAAGDSRGLSGLATATPNPFGEESSTRPFFFLSEAGRLASIEGGKCLAAKRVLASARPGARASEVRRSARASMAGAHVARVRCSRWPVLGGNPPGLSLPVLYSTLTPRERRCGGGGFERGGEGEAERRGETERMGCEREKKREKKKRFSAICSLRLFCFTSNTSYSKQIFELDRGGDQGETS